MSQASLREKMRVAIKKKFVFGRVCNTILELHGCGKSISNRRCESDRWRKVYKFKKLGRVGKRKL